MNPYAILALVAAFLAAGAGGFRLGVDHQKAQEVDKVELVAEAVDAANNASAAILASLRPKYTTIQGKLEKQIETNTVYRDCKVPEEAMQLVNDALSPELASGTPRREAIPPKAADR